MSTAKERRIKLTTQEEFLGGGGLALAFEDVGDSYTLIVTEEPLIEQTRDYDTDELEFWPDGRKKERWVVYGVLEDGEQQIFEGEDYELEDEDDDGERRLYIQSFNLTTWRKTLKQFKPSRIDPGDRVFVELDELKDNGRKRKPSKMLVFEIDKGARPDLVPVAEKVDAQAESMGEDEEDEAPAPRARRGRAAAAPAEKAAPAKRRRAAAVVEEDEEDDEPAAAPPKRGRGRAAAAGTTAKPSTRRRAAPAEDADEDEPAAPAKKARGRASATPVTDGAKSARTSARRRAAEAAAAAEDDDDEPPF